MLHWNPKKREREREREGGRERGRDGEREGGREREREGGRERERGGIINIEGFKKNITRHDFSTVLSKLSCLVIQESFKIGANETLNHH